MLNIYICESNFCACYVREIILQQKANYNNKDKVS